MSLAQMDPEERRALVIQEMNEERFNRKHIDVKIKKEIEDSTYMQGKIEAGVAAVREWMGITTYYASKLARIKQLKGYDLTELVTDIFIGIAYYQRLELFTSVTAQMAARLRFSDKTEAITTVAELLAVLCNTDAFDIVKEHKMGSLMVISRIPLSDGLMTFIENSQYLPPMVCAPLELKHNYSSGYLTHNDSLLLGQGNHHDGDLCLDVLNIMNSVQLKMDLQFLDSVSEEPSHALETQEQVEQWQRFLKQSRYFYALMAQQGNRFYLTHKVDKRGRIYACGYHINSQGAPFKKAMLELVNEEIVTGVPT